MGCALFCADLATLGSVPVLVAPWDDSIWPFTEQNIRDSTTDELVATILAKREVTVYSGGSLFGIATEYSQLAAGATITERANGGIPAAVDR
eukprot:9755168-Heterocapsa_arctica.AAC.1